MQYKTKADLDRSVDELKKLSRTFSRQYLYTNESRANFSLEIDQLIQFAQRDISIHCTSYSGAISIIERKSTTSNNKNSTLIQVKPSSLSQ